MPISQLSSFVSNHKTQLLSSVPKYKHEIPVPTTLDEVHRMLVDSTLPASSSTLNETKISSLNLDNTHIPNDPPK
jgi:hypothetical protein